LIEGLVRGGLPSQHWLPNQQKREERKREEDGAAASHVTDFISLRLGGCAG